MVEVSYVAGLLLFGLQKEQINSGNGVWIIDIGILHFYVAISVTINIEKVIIILV